MGDVKTGNKKKKKKEAEKEKEKKCAHSLGKGRKHVEWHMTEIEVE